MIQSNRSNIKGVGPKAFTLVEILIVVAILGILASLVVPQFSNAAKLSRENAYKEDLRYMRTQIIIYNSQHNGVPPGYPGGDTSKSPTANDFIDQLTKPTSVAGVVGAKSDGTYKFGPYLQHAPINPLISLNTIRIIGAGKFPATAEGTHGWIYQPTTMSFAGDATGADESGKEYIDY